MVKLIITGKTLKPFKGDEGEMIPYCWYKAERITDGVTLQFGSKHTAYEIGDEIETALEKREGKGGKARWIEIQES